VPCLNLPNLVEKEKVRGRERGKEEGGEREIARNTDSDPSKKSLADQPPEYTHRTCVGVVVPSDHRGHHACSNSLQLL
jgi:hypothetical protein